MIGAAAGGVTVTVTGAEVMRTPSVPAALAVSVKLPVGTLGQITLYGAVWSSPSVVVPQRNSTLVIVASALYTSATSVMSAGAEKAPLLAWAVRLTAGG